MKSSINYILFFFLAFALNGLNAQTTEPACTINCSEGQAINVDLSTFLGTPPNSFVEAQWWTTEDRQPGTQVASPYIATEPGDYFAFYYDAINDCYNEDVSTAFIRIQGCTVIDLFKSGVYVDVNTDGVVNVGDLIEYTFTVSNNGNIPVSDITITDAMVTVNGGPISLAPGQSDNTTFTASYSITQADIDAGGVWNLAIVNGNDPDGPIDPVESEDPDGPLDPNNPNYDEDCENCTFTELDQNGGIALVKTVTSSSPYGLGDNIEYTFTITNTGNVTLTDIDFTDELNGVDLAQGLTWAESITANQELEVGEVWTATAEYTITQADIDAGGVSNQASVTANDPNDNPVTDDSGTGTGNDNPTDTPLDQNGGIALVKTVTSSSPYGLGDNIEYTFTITNTGNVTLTDIDFTDELNGVDLAQGLTWTESITDNQELEVGEVWTATAEYTITQADIDAGGVSNQASVTANDPNDNPVTDDSGTGTGNDNPTDTPLDQNGAIAITKSGTYVDENSDGVVGLGDKISYTFTVTNTGNTTLTNVVVSDPLIDANDNIYGPVTLLPGESGTFNATYTITQQDLDNGGVWNIATATGNDPNDEVTGTSTDPNPLDPTDPNYDEDCPNCTFTPLDPSEIIANDDGFGPIDGTSGGTTTETVFDNDLLNGNQVDPDDVTLTYGDAEDEDGNPITQGGVVMNPDGTITVNPFTPSGIYTIEYTICENVNPNNCDTATVTITVEGCFAGDQPVQLKCD